MNHKSRILEGKQSINLIERWEYEKDMWCTSRNGHIVLFQTEVHIQSQLLKGQRSTQMAIKLNGSWNKEKRTYACVLVFVRVCACAHEGLRKIIAIDLRRRNVEMLPDGTFSCEWLRMRRVILERPGQRDAANAHENIQTVPQDESTIHHQNLRYINSCSWGC